VHTNPLQEALQPEGTSRFRGGVEALRRLCEQCSVPVILKETGCGFSGHTLRKLLGVGLFAVDVSGYGGTHWGRIEGHRVSKDHPWYGAADAFKEWGISTVDSLLAAKAIPNKDYQVWASGGIRNGCEAAKCLALGAVHAGVARLIVQAALQGADEVERVCHRMEYELKLALFCLGCSDIEELQNSKNKKWMLDNRSTDSNIRGSCP